MAQEDVLIKFSVDYAELDAAIATLEKTGKLDPKTAAAFSQTSKAIATTASDTQGLIQEFKNVSQTAVKMGKTVEDAFGAGVQDALDEAGVSVDEFAAALKKANAPAVTLKKELALLKEQMARLKAAGKDTGSEFETLRAKAGKLADAIQDTNLEIKNAGSDTRGLDNVLGSVTALAGGFAAVQGATALFGDENEDLQKALLKVNGAMAVAQGLQVVYNATLKEGALTKLADTIATGAQSAAQRVYAIAVGTSTGAMKAFRIALLATGIGAIVAVLLLAADAMGLFGTKTDEATDKAAELADGIKKLNIELENNITTLNRSGQLQLESLKQQGATEQQLHEKSIALLKEQNLLTLQTSKDKIRLLGVEDLVRTKQDADNLISIKERVLATKGITDANKELFQAQIDGLKEVSEAFKKIDETEFDIALSNAQFRTKLLADAKKQREKDDKDKLDAIEKARKAEMDSLAAQMAANLKADSDREDQLRIHFENEQDIIERDRAAKEEINAKWDALRKQMQADLVKSSEDAAKKQQDAEDELMRKRVQNAETIIAIGKQIGDVFSQIAALQTQRDDNLIRSKRREIDEQLRAGVITAKAAEARQKQLDIFERRARQKAAQREKQAAVFQAALAVPQAFLTGLKTNIYVALIYAALAAAQAAIIASKPVPQFFRGKKNRYEGPGVVGDMGSELVERGGRMFLYTKPTQTYLGANDKVYTAAETRKIMHNTHVNTTIVKDKPVQFDYDRFARAIPAAGININIDRDGVTEWTTGQMNRTKYLDKRYRK